MKKRAPYGALFRFLARLQVSWGSFVAFGE
jgi:hypothetical protein